MLYYYSEQISVKTRILDHDYLVSAEPREPADDDDDPVIKLNLAGSKDDSWSSPGGDRSPFPSSSSSSSSISSPASSLAAPSPSPSFSSCFPLPPSSPSMAVAPSVLSSVLSGAATCSFNSSSPLSPSTLFSALLATVALPFSSLLLTVSSLAPFSSKIFFLASSTLFCSSEISFLFSSAFASSSFAIATSLSSFVLVSALSASSWEISAFNRSISACFSSAACCTSPLSSSTFSAFPFSSSAFLFARSNSFLSLSFSAACSPARVFSSSTSCSEWLTLSAANFKSLPQEFPCSTATCISVLLLPSSSCSSELNFLLNQRLPSRRRHPEIIIRGSMALPSPPIFHIHFLKATLSNSHPVCQSYCFKFSSSYGKATLSDCHFCMSIV